MPSQLPNPEPGQGHTTVHLQPDVAPRNQSIYPVLLALFVAVFMISNITATKGVQIGPLVTDGAFFLFPIAYIIGDVLAECYGFKATRRAIWTGFAAMLIAVASFTISIALPPADFYDNQDAFASTLSQAPQIVVASLAGYLIGQMLNAGTLVAIKKRTGEKSLWVRLLGSSVIGQFGDTLVFCLIAASVIGISTVGDAVNYIIVGFVWKTLAEVIAMPLTYLTVGIVKRREASL